MLIWHDPAGVNYYHTKCQIQKKRSIMKISCFDYDGCLDELRRLIIEGKSDLEFDSNIWTDRSYQNRANLLSGRHYQKFVIEIDRKS